MAIHESVSDDDDDDGIAPMSDIVAVEGSASGDVEISTPGSALPPRGDGEGSGVPSSSSGVTAGDDGAGGRGAGGAGNARRVGVGEMENGGVKPGRARMVHRGGTATTWSTQMAGF